MKSLLFILIFLLSCTSNTNPSFKKKYFKMNALWSENASKAEVIKTLGKEFDEIKDGIIYKIQNGQLVESGHFFDNSQKLVEQFILVDQNSLKDLKQNISCEWKEREEKKGVGHTVQTIESGVCRDKNITYEYRPDIRLYEVRWKE
ncbi:MAG: hypothetical protein ACLGHN_13970 [Bacteriovoracia bacterium]